MSNDKPSATVKKRTPTPDEILATWIQDRNDLKEFKSDIRDLVIERGAKSRPDFRFRLWEHFFELSKPIDFEIAKLNARIQSNNKKSASYEQSI